MHGGCAAKTVSLRADNTARLRRLLSLRWPDTPTRLAVSVSLREVAIGAESTPGVYLRKRLQFSITIWALF